MARLRSGEAAFSAPGSGGPLRRYFMIFPGLMPKLALKAR